jgi:hypothetical protein
MTDSLKKSLSGINSVYNPNIPMKNTLLPLSIFAFALLGLCACAPAVPTAAPSSPTPPPATDEATAEMTPTAATERLLDGFEEPSSAWKPGLPPEYNDSSALEVALTGEHATQGSRALELRFDLSAAPKAIFYLESPQALNSRYLELDLYNSGVATAAAIALSTGEAWLWHESLPVPLGQAAQTISFDLSASDYLTAASGWQPVSPLAAPRETQRIAIILYPSAKGSVFIDNLRLSEELHGALPQPAPARTEAPPAVSAHPPTTMNLTILTKPSAVFEPFELAVDTDGVYLNPFDPAEVDLSVTFSGPDNLTLSAPAFWYQDFDPSTGSPFGEPGFRVRFTPPVPGKWSASALLRPPALHSDPLELTVSANPSARGLVRLHPANKRYFAFDDGSTFFPVGLNIGWGADAPVQDYTRWLDGLSANGGSIIRVWMASWSFGIEWNDTPLGDYTNRLYRAWQLDQIFRLAEERGIYVELVLLNHGAFSARVNPEWQNNPYNAANGGPCANPEDFVTNLEARGYFERRLRYVAARWAYSPNLFAWEWWNEANWTPIADPAMTDWIQAMTPVLKANDPYDHLISTSYADGARPAVNNLAEIDFAQLHLYDSSDPAASFPDLAEQWNQQIPDKPVLFAEFGASAGVEDANSFDRGGLHLHNGLWAATFNGFASPAMYWWWDLYVDPLNLWGVYGRLTKFLDGEDLATLQPVDRFAIDPHGPVVNALGSQNRLLFWIHDRQNSGYYLEQARYKLILDGQEPGPDWVYTPETLTGFTLKLMSLQDGSYTAYWYQPMQGKWIARNAVTVTGGKAELIMPDLTGDLALKIIPAGEKGPAIDP